MNIKFKDLYVGETVYFIDPWTKNCIKGYLTNIENDIYLVTSEYYIDREGKYEGVCDRSMTVPEDCLFPSYQAAYNNHDNRLNMRTASYLEEILDVNSLLQFAWKHCFDTADFTDTAARRAYELKAKELCDVDLDI